MAVVKHKEVIHSGHFMVSDFEPDVEDEEELMPVSTPQVVDGNDIQQLIPSVEEEREEADRVTKQICDQFPDDFRRSGAKSVVITKETSLNNLFRSMSIAYSQKLTSPKWNNFKGLRLRWRDKIRLNNVIWRCWHNQFVKGRGRLPCAFASPSDIDNHLKYEGCTLLEGKYWKRRMQTIKKEYMRWRMFYKHRGKEGDEHDLHDVQGKDWEMIFQGQAGKIVEGSKDDAFLDDIPDDFFMDALFSTMECPNSNGPPTVAFPNPRDMNKYITNSDFIQPGLMQLQPNMPTQQSELEELFSSFGVTLPDWIEGMGAKQDETTQNNSQNNMAPEGRPKAEPVYLQPSQSFEMNLVPQPQRPTPNLSQNLNQTHNLAPQSIASQVTNLNSVHQFVVQPPTVEFQQNYNGTVALFPDNQELFNKPFMVDQKPHPPVYPKLEPEPSTSSYPTSNPHKRHMISCKSDKRHSPKHRILHHHNEEDHMTCQSPISGAYRVAKSPSFRECRVTDPPFPSIESPRLKARSKSGSAVPTRRQNSYSKTNGEMAQANPVRLNSYSEVNGEVGQGNPVGTSNTNSELVQLLRRFKGVQIPPPPASSAPQPHISLPSPPSPMDDDSDETRSSGLRHRSGHATNNSEDYREHRGDVHTSAEQKRRGNLKNGFDHLRSLIPSLQNSPSSHKISKAALLHKGGDYLQQLKAEKEKGLDEMQQLRNRANLLKNEISHMQRILTVKDDKIGTSLVQNDTRDNFEDRFLDHVAECSKVNWKYWVFSKMFQPALPSFQKTARTGDFKTFSRSTLTWLDQEFSLESLRPNVIDALTNLCKTTDVLDKPEILPEEAVRRALMKKL